MREFVFALEFDPGTNPVADILAAHSETRLRSLSCHVTAETLWRVDHVTGSEAALDAVVVFLDKNDDRAWKATTIAEQLGLDTDAVSAILSRLRQRGLCGTSTRTGRSQMARNGSNLPTGSTDTTRMQTNNTVRSVSRNSRPTRWKRYSDCIRGLGTWRHRVGSRPALGGRSPDARAGDS